MRKLTATLATATVLAMLATASLAAVARADWPRDERAQEHNVRIVKPTGTHDLATVADPSAPKDERALERGLRIVKPAEPVNAASQVDPGPATPSQPATAGEHAPARADHSGHRMVVVSLAVSALLVALAWGNGWLRRRTRSHPRQAI
jgi:hypothetical protein